MWTTFKKGSSEADWTKTQPFRKRLDQKHVKNKNLEKNIYLE
jgi:hypothetical protein